MKKFIFYIILIVITFSFIEIGSWSTIKVYQLINNSKKNTDIQAVIAEVYTIDGQSPGSLNEYQAFYGWSKKDIASKHINIKNSLRKTKKNPNWNSKSKIWFFGGSTMWGSYVSDENTIPSLSSDLNHNFQSVNVGEESYVSGQSLNRLIEINDEINEGDHVVFFDGVNDTFHNCQSVFGPNGHGEVNRIRRLISNEKNFFKGLYVQGLAKFKMTNTFTVLNGIGKRIGLQDLKKIDDFKYYSCNKSEYAFKVAESLVRHWKIAEIITKNKKANFTCILQPNPYTANFKVNQLTREVWKRSTLAVYPKIKELAKSLDCFNDLTSVFKEDYYLDYCCHVTSEGNKIISKKIIDILFEK
jgi:hypothetical protein